MVNTLAGWPVILLVVLFSSAISFSQDVRQAPDPRGGAQGQRITATDGDTVVIEGDARVRVVRRRPAFVRLIADAEHRFAIVIAEHLSAFGDTPLRLSGKTHTFHSVEGQWPLPARWEGHAWLEEEASFDGFGVGGFAVETAAGTIVLARRGPFEESQSAAQGAGLTYMGISTTGSGGMAAGRRPFDDVELQELANARRSANQNGVSTTGGPNGSNRFGWSSGIAVSSEAISGEPRRSAAGGAVRAGGNIPQPRKVHHVDPVMPEQARSARVMGAVIVEITVGADGAVQDARVLRSIPVLDQAVLDAVRQWRYDPPLVNGVPTPVIMTAPVSVGDQPRDE